MGWLTRNSWERTIGAMGKVGNVRSEPGPDVVRLDDKRRDAADIVCLEGSGARPSHKGDGWSVGGGRCIR